MAALVLVSGGPASGKTATAQAVAAALRDAGMPVVVVSEEGDPATLYAGESSFFFFFSSFVLCFQAPPVLASLSLLFSRGTRGQGRCARLLSRCFKSRERDACSRERGGAGVAEERKKKERKGDEGSKRRGSKKV